MGKIREMSIFVNCIIIILLLSGCNINNKNDDMLKEKVIQEIKYLDIEIVDTLNKTNNIYFETTSILNTDNSDIDWKDVKQEIENINILWNSMVVDLYSLDLNGDDILEFSTNIDGCIISIQNEDKQKTLINLANLYNLIPKYISGILGENSDFNIKQTKAHIINAYSIIEENNWDLIADNINKADNCFQKVMSNLEYVKDKEYIINKTYVLLKELQKSIINKNQKIFYIKYKNLIESINNIQ